MLGKCYRNLMQSEELEDALQLTPLHQAAKKKKKSKEGNGLRPLPGGESTKEEANPFAAVFRIPISEHLRKLESFLPAYKGTEFNLCVSLWTISLQVAQIYQFGSQKSWAAMGFFR